MTTNEKLLSEHFKPKTLDELNLSPKDIASLKSMACNKGSLKNLLFHGGPGIGKTSAAQILINDMEMSAGTLSKAKIHNIRGLKGFMEGYYSSCSLFGEFKVLIINEVDRFNNKEQDYLLEAIEEHVRNGRFIFTCNDISKLLEPLKSRLIPINFDLKQKDKQEVIEKMVARYDAGLKQIGKPLALETISTVVNVHFPDLRKVANKLDYETLALAS
jgi:replication-associated recombination protein RarA